MSSEEESLGDRIERGIAEENPADFSLRPHLVKVALVFAGYAFSGWPGVVSLVYVFIGDSLARRVGQERWRLQWFGVVFLWPVLLALDVADVDIGGAE